MTDLDGTGRQMLPLLAMAWTSAFACRPSSDDSVHALQFPDDGAVLMPEARLWFASTTDAPYLRVTTGGEEVELTVETVPGTDMWTFRPDEPWPEGEYELTVYDASGVADLGTRVFTVDPDATASAASPVPVRHQLRSEAWVQDAGDCATEGTWSRTTDVLVELCIDAPLVLAASGAEPPPDRSLDGPDVGSPVGDELYLSSDSYPLEPGGPVHLWFGAFDETGAFLGWSELELEMPAAGEVVVTERDSGAAEVPAGTATITDASVACDSDAPWIEIERHTPSRPEADGCTTSGIGSIGLFAWLMALTGLGARSRTAWRGHRRAAPVAFLPG